MDELALARRHSGAIDERNLQIIRGNLDQLDPFFDALLKDTSDMNHDRRGYEIVRGFGSLNFDAKYKGSRLQVHGEEFGNAPAGKRR